MVINHQPQHIAIIMDGNGRWAKNHKRPRIFGHKSGTKAVKNIVEYCAKHKIFALTLFAFSTENWSRTKKEVDLLIDLFINIIQSEINRLHRYKIRLTIIGDISKFPQKLQDTIKTAEQKTKANQGLRLNIAANYGGRWDIIQAVQKIFHDKPKEITESIFAKNLSLSDLPDIDLFIRTGGELRISNFLLWQLAYAELYFTSTLWPDFNIKDLQQAIEFFQTRERRFGRTSEQLS